MHAWSALDGAKIVSFSGHQDQVSSVAFNPEGTILASASLDGTVKLWDTSDFQARLEPSNLANLGSTESMALSPNGTQIATASNRNTFVFDLATGRRIHQLPDDSPVYCCAWNRDGRFLATGHLDGKVKLWDVVAEKLLWSTSPHSLEVMALAWAPDDLSLVSGSLDNSIKLHRAETGEEIRSIPAAGRVSSFSSDSTGTRFSMVQGLSVVVAEWADLSEIRRLKTDLYEVRSVALSPDGRYLAACGAPKPGDRPKIQLWEVSSGRLIRSLFGHNSRINSVVWSPDGRRLASGEANGTFKVWDADTGDQVLSLTSHTRDITKVVWHPDGARIITSAHDGVRIWDASKAYEMEAQERKEAP